MKPEEFNHIIIPMRASLEQLARKMTGDDSRAEDLVQEVMLKCGAYATPWSAMTARRHWPSPC